MLYIYKLTCLVYGHSWTTSLNVSYQLQHISSHSVQRHFLLWYFHLLYDDKSAVNVLPPAKVLCLQKHTNKPHYCSCLQRNHRDMWSVVSDIQTTSGSFGATIKTAPTETNTSTINVPLICLLLLWIVLAKTLIGALSPPTGQECGAGDYGVFPKIFPSVIFCFSSSDISSSIIKKILSISFHS